MEVEVFDVVDVEAFVEVAFVVVLVDETVEPGAVETELVVGSATSSTT